MRIAVSGTHFIGKTTLIDDLVFKHPEYRVEQEAYHQLIENQEIDAELGPSFEQMLEQLQFNLECMQKTQDQSNIVFDRCAVDCLVYAMCALEQEDSDIQHTEMSELFEEIRHSLSTLDLIVFLPLSSSQPIVYTEENPEYREKADRYFKKIYRDDPYGLFPKFNQPRIIEVEGSREKRIQILESYMP